METSEQPVKDSQQSTQDAMSKLTSQIMGLPEETPQGEPNLEGAEQATDDLGEQPQEDSSQIDAASDVEEVEFEGKKFNVPKEIKDALLRQSDYTRKTQEVSEARRTVAEQERLLKAEQEFHFSIIDDIGQLRAIDGQLSQYQQINWGQMDSDTLVRTKIQFDQLKEARQNLIGQIQSKRSNFEQRRAQSLGEMQRAGYQLLTQKVSGFNESTQKELREFMLKEGYTEPEVSGIYDARQVAIAWKALQYDKLQASKPNIQNRANKAPPVIKPGASSKPVSQDAQLHQKMHSAKSQNEKKRYGAEILARKLGI